MAASSFDSPESSVLNVSEEKTNGTRLARLLIDGGTHTLRKYFDTIHPPEKLKDALNNNKGRLEALRKKGVIFNSQWEKLFPSSGDAPKSGTFDITLLHLLLREICHLTAPSTGWHKMPADDDNSPEARIAKIKCFRNELCHSISTGVPNDVFEARWDDIASSLVALGLDQREVDHLKTDPIDHDTQRRVEEEVKRLDSEYKVELQEVKQNVQELQDKVSSIQDSISKPSTPALPSCLPDEHPHVVGRSTEIKQVTEAVQSEAVSVVLITGGPGFGKTAVANKAAHALKTECDETAVLFCSIRSKQTLNDVATEMVLVCSSSIGQPPENPKRWLLNWSKQRSHKVVFILDNADDVLHFNERDEFSSLLGQMRNLSVQNVKFVITTRIAFKDPNLQMSEVRLGCLSPEDARQVLVSRVQSQEGHEISKADTLAERCGFVPLALCIAGSLLPDYTEDELIAQLASDPLDVLQDDQRPAYQISVEKAIKASFDFLAVDEQKALVLLSAFPGSFNSDAAKGILGASNTEVNPVRIIRSLKSRSLLEQPSGKRHEIHLLIQAFVKKIGRDRFPQLLSHGRKLACSHFTSRIASTTEMYWSKNRCTESIKSFNEDRNNFEHFLRVGLNGMETEGKEDFLEITHNLLENILQKCLFLEMCLLPSVYTELLNMFVRVSEFDKQTVHKTVGLLCLLGHESRKVGNRERYYYCLDKAIKLHSENITKFDGETYSESVFLNTYARYLAESKKQTEQVKELYEKSLKLCKAKLSTDDVQMAMTLMFAGREDNYSNERDKAERKFNEALDLLKKCLGKHVLTALALKDIADFNLFLGSTQLAPKVDNWKSLDLYKEALQMIQELGMKDQKESILPLTNLGICQQRADNVVEANSLFQNAYYIAERELDKDHRWKIYVKTQMAYLHHREGKQDLANKLKEEAMEMSERLGLPDNQPPNKFLLLKL